MASVKLENVCKSYDNEKNTIKNLNLEVKDREFIVFVGPSGCGKSTTLRMIAGLEEITEGNLYIDDKLSNGTSPSKRDIAMVFQNYALYPHMSVRANLGFALKMAKIDKKIINEKVEQVASMLELEGYLDKKPKSLSGGQRQRVALGRAMVRNPKVFLFDEPLSNLDSKLRVNMRTEIVNFHKKLNATFIYVTHDQIEAMTMGDRIVVMNGGEIEQVDTPKNLYKKPTNTFVAQFIGSPKMNMFNARIKEDNGRYLLVCNKIEQEISNLFYIQDEDMGEVLLGIRAENIHDARDRNFDFDFEVEIEAVEDIGSDMFIYFYDKDVKMVARVDIEDEIEAQTKIKLGFSLSDIHLFSKKSGKRIVKR